MTEPQERPESPDATAQSASREYQAKRATKEVLDFLEFPANVALTVCPVCLAIKATPATPEHQAPSVLPERLDLRENLVYPDFLDRRVYLATFLRKEIEDTRVFRDLLAPSVPLEHLVMMESLVRRESLGHQVKACLVFRAHQERRELMGSQDCLELQEKKVPREHLVFPALKETGASPDSQVRRVNRDVMAHQVYQDQRDWTAPLACPVPRANAAKMVSREFRVPPDLSDLPEHLVSPAWTERQAKRETVATLASPV